jgi:hypothetical protein
MHKKKYNPYNQQDMSEARQLVISKVLLVKFKLALILLITVSSNTLKAATEPVYKTGNSVIADAQLAFIQKISGYWAPRFVPHPEGEVFLKSLPEGVIYIDDTGGAELEEGDYAGLKLTQRAIDEIKEYDFSQELTSEFACVQPSAPLYMQAPFPMEWWADNNLMVLKMEYFDMYRIIHLDGRGHTPEDAPHSKSGHSIGHFVGGARVGVELLVDTDHLSSGTLLNNGFSHSNDMQMIERFRLSTDGRTLFSLQIYEDPKVFEGRAARFIAWDKKDDYVYPYECDPTFGK